MGKREGAGAPGLGMSGVYLISPIPAGLGKHRSFLSLMGASAVPIHGGDAVDVVSNPLYEKRSLSHLML